MVGLASCPTSVVLRPLGMPKVWRRWRWVVVVVKEDVLTMDFVPFSSHYPERLPCRGPSVVGGWARLKAN